MLLFQLHRDHIFFQITFFLTSSLTSGSIKNRYAYLRDTMRLKFLSWIAIENILGKRGGDNNRRFFNDFVAGGIYRPWSTPWNAFQFLAREPRTSS